MSEIAGMKRCPKCGFHYPEDCERCPNCPPEKKETKMKDDARCDYLLFTLLVLFALFISLLFGGCALRPPNTTVQVEEINGKSVMTLVPAVVYKKAVRPIHHEDEDEHGTISRAPLSKDAMWIVTLLYANANSDTVLLNYRLYELGKCADSVMLLMESVRRQLTDAGYARVKSAPEQRVGSNHYKLLLGGDTSYSIKDHEWIRKDGNLMVLIIHKKSWARTDVKLDECMTEKAVSSLTDEIMERLEPRTYL